MPYVKQANEQIVSCDPYRAAATPASTARHSEKVQTLKPAHNWISIATRIPPSSGPYLVLLRGRKHRLMQYEANDGVFSPRGLSPVVTHWMLLPPLPA